MKKYNTSLKILFEEEMLNEGFSRLGAPRLTSDRPDTCQLDVPRSLLQYLLTSKSAGEAISILDTIKSKGVKGAPGAVFGALGEFLEGFASSIVDNPQYLQDAQSLLSLTTLTGVPSLYCKFFNLILKKIDRILAASGAYSPDAPAAPEIEKGEVLFSIFEELSKAGRIQLKNINLDDRRYSMLDIVRNHSFINSNIEFKYGYVYFENFLKEYSVSSKFDKDKLQEDLDKFIDIFNIIKSMTTEGVARVYEDVASPDVLDYEDVDVFDKELEEYEDFDKKFADSMSENGKNAKNIIIKEFASFLLIVITKMFYDIRVKSMIDSDALAKLEEIRGMLKKNGGDENYKFPEIF